MSEGEGVNPGGSARGVWRAIWVGAAGVVLGSAIWWALTALGAHLTVHFH